MIVRNMELHFYTSCKIVTQMYVLFETLTPIVEPNFNGRPRVTTHSSYASFCQYFKQGLQYCWCVSDRYWQWTNL